MGDFVHAVRALRKSPGFSTVAILTIAVGIGANTSLFSIYDRLVLHRVTIPDASTLVAIWTNNPQLNLNAPALSWPRYEEMRDGARSFASIGISAFDNFTLTGNGDPELTGLRVSASFLPTLGVMPIVGRNFTADEDVPNGPAVCILSHELWQTRFGGRPIVGDTITLNAQPWQVVGITPPHLTAPFGQVQIFAPRVYEVGGLTPVQVQNGAGYAQPIARLKPGVTRMQADEELAAISRASHDRVPTRLDANNTSQARDFVESLVGNLQPTFNALIGAVGFVLLIACANVAALFLSRLTSRQKEIAVRQSLGATRGMVVRQFIVESLVFSAIAGAAGLLLALWALSAVQALVASQLPPGTTLSLNTRALLFTAGVSALTAFLVGVVPAMQASRGPVVEVLKDNARGSSTGRGGRFRGALIVGEVALSVVLLVGSTLLLVSFVRLEQTDLGFDPRGAATAFVSLPAARYKTPDERAQFFDQAIERLRAEPGVSDAAAALNIPMTGFNPRSPYAIGGRPVPPLPQRAIAGLGVISDDYFKVMRIRLVAGRVFDGRDRAGSPPVCVVSESFAKRLFPGESAVGKIVLRGRDADIRAEIVGVVGDVHTVSVSTPPQDDLYYPMRQIGQVGVGVIARTAGDPNQLQATIRAAVAAVDPNQPISLFTTFDTNVANSLGAQRIVASLTVVFAGIALVLSAVGLYSVVAYAVAQRTAEIGIRMALGAQRGQVIGLVMRGGLQLVAVGLAIGLAAAAGTARLIQTLLYEVKPMEPVVYGGVAVLFTAIAAVACLIPSLRAARIDPLNALRAD
jgi:predicted permease